MSDYETPEVGMVFKHVKLSGRFNFLNEQRNGDIIWWNFINDEKQFHSFYPDEVYRADAKSPRKKRGSREVTGRTLPDTLVIDGERKEIIVTDKSGDSITII